MTLSYFRFITCICDLGRVKKSKTQRVKCLGQVGRHSDSHPVTNVDIAGCEVSAKINIHEVTKDNSSSIKSR